MADVIATNLIDKKCSVLFPDKKEPKSQERMILLKHVCFLICLRELLRRFQHIRSFALIKAFVLLIF